MKLDAKPRQVSALPDAPLAMPKQDLGRSRSMFASLRQRLRGLSWF